MALHFWQTITPAIQLILLVVALLMIGVSWNNYVAKVKHTRSPETLDKQRSALTLAIIVSGCGVLFLGLVITWIFIIRKNKDIS